MRPNKLLQLGGVKISFGALKLISGGLGILSQVIPVGQPFLGAIGGVGAKAVGGGFGMLEGMMVSALDTEQADSLDSGSSLMQQAAKYLNDNQQDIGKYIAKPFSRQLDKDLGSTQKLLGEIGKSTKQLASERDYLKQRLDMPEDKITEQLERLLKLETDQSSPSSKEVANKMRDIINQRISELEDHGEKYRDTIDDLHKKGKQSEALASQAAKLGAKRKKLEETAGKAVKGLAQMTGDVQDVFAGVRALCLRKEDLEPRIEAEIDRLKETVFGKRLTDLHARITAANGNKEMTMRRLERCHSAIQTSGALINRRLNQINAIDGQIMGLSGALDHTIFSSLVDLESEARATLTRQLYYFAKAYQYRFLRKVSPEFYRLDRFIARLEKFLSTAKTSTTEQTFDADSSSDSNVALDDKDYAEMYELLQQKISSQINFLTDDVQHNKLAKKSTWLIHARELMDEQALQKLNTPLSDKQGGNPRYAPYTFNLVKAGYAMPNAVKLRITNIKLKSVSLDDLAQFRHGLNFRLKFIHSGISVLYDGDAYYLFRAQTPTEQISWEYTVSIDSHGQVDIRPVTVSDVDIELLNDLSGGDSKSDELLSVYSPAGTSDITLHRQSAGGVNGGVISDFVIEVTLEEFHAGH